MCAKIAYLHAGMHKTGSTTLQGFLDLNVNALRLAGLAVPTFNGKTSSFHRNLSLEFGGSPRAETQAGTFADLNAMIVGLESDLLISWELFSVYLPDPDRLEWLVGFFKRRGFRLHVIGYVRDHAEYFNSRYSQEVKRLLTGVDFTEYLKTELSDPRHDPAHLFGTILEHPEVDVTIRSFEVCARTGLEWSLLDVVLPRGYDRQNFVLGEVRNEAPSAIIVYLSRLVHSQLAKAGRLNGLSHEQIKAYGRKIRRVAQQRCWAGEKFCGLDAVGAARIREMWRERADAFAQRAWGTSWPTPPQRTYHRNEFDPRTAAPALVADLQRMACRIVSKLEESNAPHGDR